MTRKQQGRRPNSNSQEDPNKPSEKVMGFSVWIPVISVKWMKPGDMSQVLFLCASLTEYIFLFTMQKRSTSVVTSPRTADILVTMKSVVCTGLYSTGRLKGT